MHFSSGTLWRENRTLRYLLVGGWNTLFGYGIFAGLYLILNEDLSYLLIAVMSHFLAVTQSFITQRRFVFCSGQPWAGEYMRFHIAHLGSLLAGLIALRLLVETIGVPPLLAQAVATVLITVLSYFLHLHFTFRQRIDDER